MTKPLADRITRLIEDWRRDPNIAGNIAFWQNLPARAAQYAELPLDLDPRLREFLLSENIEALYSHQAESWQAIDAGKNVVIVTGTASGKTLCYNLPILQTALQNPHATALYLFPTKALAQDQKTNIDKFLEFYAARFPQDEKLHSGIYDGDTPSNQRTRIRTAARLVLSNPDMLHLSILPHHTLWAPFLENLRFVVLDEMHIYRGVFGSHVANVIRRLKRIFLFYGVSPQFVMTSATIANPQELAQNLVEEDVEVISRDGSPFGGRHFIIYNPPIVQEVLGVRASVREEAVRLLKTLAARDVQTLLFARSRRQVEMVLRELREKLPESRQTIRGYRSGYLKQERREIESDLRQGKARIVVATNALELGIDIGSADAVVMAGYPGSIASTTQQAGRAGRRTEVSLAALIAAASPLDQFLVTHPEYLTDNSPEKALINPNNLLILLNHLKCSLFELPFGKQEGYGKVPLELIRELVELLLAANLSYASGDKYFWVADQYPSAAISLRSTSASTIQLQVRSGGQTLLVGEVDQNSAFWLVHPDAIYLHEGQSYKVDELNIAENQALLSPVNVEYFTIPQTEVSIKEIEKKQSVDVPGGVKNYGEILVTSQVTGFKKISWNTYEILEKLPLEMPAQELRTVAYWLTLNAEHMADLQSAGLWKNDTNDYGPSWPRIRRLVRSRDQHTCQVCGRVEHDQEHHVHHITPFRNFTNPDLANQLDNLITLCPGCHQRAEASVRMRSGLSGLGYVLHHLAPLYLMCDINDLGSHVDPTSPLAEGNPAIVLYDMIPDGIGLAEAIFEIDSVLLESALDLVSVCQCLEGCPACVGPAGENGSGGKVETLALLRVYLGKSHVTAIR